jgi:hypothetical protein
MSDWVAEEAPHVIHFERTCKAQGVSTEKRAPGEYVDSQAVMLWQFYVAGARQENHKWMSDYA